MDDLRRRLAVLGSPISHSKSPTIHDAAYRVLGLPWEYRQIEVVAGGLGAFLSSLDDSWRGLSLTMPLKREVLPYLDESDAVVRLTGVANTVLFDASGRHGFNTDVFGIESMLREAALHDRKRVLILGGGATACSVLVALSSFGTREIIVSTRSPDASFELLAVAARLNIEVTIGGVDIDPGQPDLVISTLPGMAPLFRKFPRLLRESVPLVDIAYDPSPTALTQHWIDGGGGVLRNGLGMLVYQALAQVRIFVNGDPNIVLERERDVLAAMRRAAIASL